MGFGDVLDVEKDLAALFEEQVKATPDAVAVEDVDKSLTYAELEQETRLLAVRLQQEYGVRRDSLVGILMGRSADYVIASLAALRAGGAFLVLEMAYPDKLLRKVVQDARPKVILTHLAHRDRLSDDFPVIVYDADEDDDDEEEYKTKELVHAEPHDLDRLAFVSYSSGTTGQPKGIANPHRAAVGSYDLRFGVCNLQKGDRVACNVFFIWEMLRPLLRGATTVAVPDQASYDPEALVEFLNQRKINDTLMTPTLLTTVLTRHPKPDLPHLRSLWLNGEVVTIDLCDRAAAALPQTRLFNVYSASETHEVSAGEVGKMVPLAKASGSSVCPVGPLLDPEHVYIVHTEGHDLVQPGNVGELCVGGPLLARNYLNLPEATAKAFVQNHYKRGGGKLYRTGDAARVTSDGLLEITGRIGGMIKSRGYTIQPGAVEAAIVKRLAVRVCAVVGHGEGMDKRLVAYIVQDPHPKGRPWPTIEPPLGHSHEARRLLANDLAHYMIPSVWIQLDTLPTHAVSGKIDTKALPSPPITRPSTPVNAASASGARQIRVETIIEAWAAALGVPREAISDEVDFFDLGGHSLSLADLSSKLTKAFGFHVPLAALAGNASLQGHLSAVTAARDGHLAELQADLPAVMQADCKLDDDIAYKKPAKPIRLSEARTILLTGATGYLGAFLLRSLVDRCAAKIICLVRFPQPSEELKPAAMARIRSNLIDLGLWHDGLLDRIEAIPGNLPQLRLGLPEKKFAALAEEVDLIIHGAAVVNLVYPYGALRAANVGGTREILRLAALGGATVHHVSSNGVLPISTKSWPESAQFGVQDIVEHVADGYGQTKWVAEQLVQEAKARGIHASIIRPGTLSGCSQTGSSNPYDLLNAIVVESLRLGQAPIVEGWRCEMTPVNYVADAIAALAEYDGRESAVYHLSDPTPLHASEVFDILDKLGFPTKRLPWDEWVEAWEKMIEEKSKSAKQPFTTDILKGGLPTPEGLKAIAILDNSITKPIVEQKLNVQRPKIDAELWQTYLRHFYARGWLPRSPVSSGNLTATGAGFGALKAAGGGKLQGKVAVVTGASSGIGAAVAVALAQEGASVAIAARRKDALLDVERRMKAANAHARVLIAQTDVTSAEQVDRLMKQAAGTLGGEVDILVSCAGVMYFTMMANVQLKQWDQTVDVNCKGLLHCLASTVPNMLKNGKGHIVAISSDAGRKTFAGLGVYSASKFFVESTLQALRLETAGKGLRVTSIQPGNVSTDLLGMSTDEEALKVYGTPSGAKVLDAEDVARAIVYAVTQPEHVAVNEVLVEPRDEPI